MELKKLSIVILAYNEARTIHRILDKVGSVQLLGWEKQIIVVNDASWDDTGNVLRNYRKIIRAVA